MDTIEHKVKLDL